MTSPAHSRLNRLATLKCVRVRASTLKGSQWAHYAPLFAMLPNLAMHVAFLRAAVQAYDLRPITAESLSSVF
eukprot:12999721-Alexandrium_andersonii.AAC.1